MPTTTSPSRSACGSWWPGWPPSCGASSAAELAARPATDLGDLRIDAPSRRVWITDAEVHLTPTEFDLLVCLAGSPGVVLTREHLYAEVWGWAGASGTRTVDSHVKALRAKIGPDRVRTVHGVGYAPEPGDSTSSPLLDQVTSVKVKLGLLVAVKRHRGLGRRGDRRRRRSAVLAQRPRDRGAGPRRDPAARRGDDLTLREMTTAARRMARGDYSGRVTATSSDEVGELARAFNRMAEDLAAVDRQRRELVANVSHELRTPLAALCAVLENLVDGVSEPDPAALRAALGQAERLATLASDLLDLARGTPARPRCPPHRFPSWSSSSAPSPRHRSPVVT